MLALIMVHILQKCVMTLGVFVIISLKPKSLRDIQLVILYSACNKSCSILQSNALCKGDILTGACEEFADFLKK